LADKANFKNDYVTSLLILNIILIGLFPVMLGFANNEYIIKMFTRCKKRSEGKEVEVYFFQKGLFRLMNQERKFSLVDPLGGDGISLFAELR